MHPVVTRVYDRVVRCEEQCRFKLAAWVKFVCGSFAVVAKRLHGFPGCYLLCYVLFLVCPCGALCVACVSVCSVVVPYDVFLMRVCALP